MLAARRTTLCWMQGWPARAERGKILAPAFCLSAPRGHELTGALCRLRELCATHRPLVRTSRCKEGQYALPSCPYQRIANWE